LAKAQRVDFSVDVFCYCANLTGTIAACPPALLAQATTIKNITP